MKFEFEKNEIDFETARRAYVGISFSPEKRAEQEQNDYIAIMQNFIDKFTPLAVNEEQQKYLEERFIKYKEGVLKHFNIILNAKSRVISPMITGPANFPVRQNQKRMASEMKRHDEFAEFREKFWKYTKKGLSVLKTNEQKNDEEFNRLKKEIDVYDKFKWSFSSFYGKIERSFKNYPESAIKALKYLQTKYKIPKNAKILRLLEKPIEEHIKEQEESKKEIENKGVQEVSRQGNIAILYNYEIDRVQINFLDNEKPSEEIRKLLKGNGFKWSPKNGVWQRQLTQNGKWASERVVKQILEMK